MIAAPLPPNESERLAALRHYDLLDTAPEPEFDDFTRLAALICGTPIALISLVDAGRQWFKSKVGLDATETPREVAFCAHAILGREVFEVPNALQDERFFDSPLVAGAPNIRFYAGAPLATSEGHCLGTLCVIDRQERRLSQEQIDALTRLGRQVVMQLELRLANRKLSSASAFQTSILDSAPSGIIAATAQGLITLFNRSAEEMLGFRADEMIGKQTPGLFHDPSEVVARAAELSQLLGRTIAPGFEVFVALALQSGAETREWTYVRKDGSRFPVLLSVSAIRSVEDEVIGFLGVARDITERKRMEEQLRETTSKAEAGSRQLAAANAELQVAIERADAATAAAEGASRAKSEFLATMSHEIRTPMNGVIGFTNLLLESPLSPEQEHFASIIKSSGEALLVLINDILDLSKIEAGKITLENIPFDLSKAVSEVVQLLSPQAQAKDLEVVVRLAPGTPRVMIGDPMRVRQILLNLTGNALKFTHKGHALVEVDRDSRSESTLRVSVTDTGIGIPNEKQSSLFKRFTQADSSTTRRFGGTGLGLVICKHLVEFMGGEIGVESIPGRGSTFWFTLPLPPEPQAIPHTVESPSFVGSRMLVVEDNPASRSVILEMLAAEQISSEGAGTGDEALEKLRAAAAARTPFTHVLIDQTLPGMGGEALARALGAEPGLPGIIRLGLTLDRHPSAVDRLLQAGFDACLFKPLVGCSELVKVLARSIPSHSGLSEVLDRRASLRDPDPLKPAGQIQHRVLLAEDNATNQLLARRLLSKAACLVDVAANGLEAVDMARNGSYDIILMDCHMPELDGYQAAEQIRRSERGGSRRIPIIAVTASVMEEDRILCGRAGMDDFVSKPLKSDDLQRTLSKWCKGQVVKSP